MSDVNGRIEAWRVDARITGYPPNGKGPSIPLGQSVGNSVELGLNWSQVRVGPSTLVKMQLPAQYQMASLSGLFDLNTAMALAYWLLSNYKRQYVEAQVTRVWIRYELTEQETGDDPVLVK